MAHPLTLIDRLRIEKAIWTLDILLGDLPGRPRRAARRDVRANLREAAAVVGTAQALHQLGPLRRLAAAYLDAEYGEGRPRPRWLRGLFWMSLVQLGVLGAAWVGVDAFEAGLLASDPHVTGTFRWTGVEHLGVTNEIT